MINLYFVYQFIKMLTTPFDQWDMYKAGIIDDKGNTLIKKSDVRDADTRALYTPFNLLVKNIKKALGKVGGKSKLASYAAALYLIKEHNMFTDELVEDIDSIDMVKLKEFVREEIANSTDIMDKKPVVHKYRKKKEKCDDADT